MGHLYQPSDGGHDYEGFGGTTLTDFEDKKELPSARSQQNLAKAAGRFTYTNGWW